MMPKQKPWLFAVLLACLIQPASSVAADLTAQSSVQISSPARPADFTQDIYYRNKLEFSLETGVLPINTPSVLDLIARGRDWQSPLDYTLVPIFSSLRWQIDPLGGPGILRGNTDLTATLSLTAIPRGPEKVYGAFDMGVRRNFVPRNWRASPYIEGRAGAGYIDAQASYGVPYAQGHNLAFTFMMGAGVRYNFSPRYSMSAGVEYMHISNGSLSEPKYLNYSINVYGPMIGVNMRLGKPKTQF
jgi:Lipid A 3-O-deacylase (PagL)